MFEKLGMNREFDPFSQHSGNGEVNIFRRSCHRVKVT